MVANATDEGKLVRRNEVREEVEGRDDKRDHDAHEEDRGAYSDFLTAARGCRGDTAATTLFAPPLIDRCKEGH